VGDTNGETAVTLGDGSSGGGSTGPDTGPDTWAPEACDLGESPFLSSDCLHALQLACRSQDSAKGCESLPPLMFSDGGYIVHCGWSKVVRFTDGNSCMVEAVHGRCEAGLEHTLIGCGDACSDTPELHSTLRAITDEFELVEMPCAPGGTALGGPLGRASAVGAPPERQNTGTCLDGVTPAPPPLCDCLSIACEAR